MENLFLIAGLGNPGAEYEFTRHNMGFLVTARLATRWSSSWRLEKKLQSRLASSVFDGKKILLAQPQTFMNLSGEAVAAIRNYFKIALSNVLVVSDDADLPFGTLRLRTQGSSGGHHGLESVAQHFGSNEFARLRVGIGRTEQGVREITGHVLGGFSSSEAEKLPLMLEKACKQLECWVQQGALAAMSQFNGK